MSGDAATLKYRQCRSDRDVMLHERIDQLLRFRAVGVHAFESGDSFAVGTDVGLLVRIKLGVHEKAVLQVVNAELGRFFVGHRTKMPRNLEAAFVRGFDGSLQLGASEIHVRLERSDAAVGPVVDKLAGLVGTAQVMHLDEGAVGSLQVRTGNVEVRADEFAFIDRSLQVQVGIGLHAAGGSKGGYAAGEIEARRGERHLRDQQRRLVIPPAVLVRAGDVEKMVVHAHDARHDGVPVQVNNGGPAGSWGVGAGLDGGDLAAFYDDVLIVHRRAPG